MKKTFADRCLEKVQPSIEGGFADGCIYDVAELAKRLKRACELLRDVDCEGACSYGECPTHDSIDELEAVPEEK